MALRPGSGQRDVRSTTATFTTLECWPLPCLVVRNKTDLRGGGGVRRGDKEMGRGGRQQGPHLAYEGYVSGWVEVKSRCGSLSQLSPAYRAGLRL